MLFFATVTTTTIHTYRYRTKIPTRWTSSDTSHQNRQRASLWRAPIHRDCTQTSWRHEGPPRSAFPSVVIRSSPASAPGALGVPAAYETRTTRVRLSTLTVDTPLYLFGPRVYMYKGGPTNLGHHLANFGRHNSYRPTILTTSHRTHHLSVYHVNGNEQRGRHQPASSTWSQYLLITAMK